MPDITLTVTDLVTGTLIVAFGVTAWRLRGPSGAARLLMACGLAWLLGSVVPALLYLHRGVLVHLVVSYPGGAPRSRVVRCVVVAGYVYGAIGVLARNDLASAVLAVAVILTAASRFGASGGPRRRALAVAAGASAALAIAFVLGATARAAATADSYGVLLSYQAIVVLTTALLAADLLWGGWSRATLTGLVVDLGESGSPVTLRDRLARAVGDRSLVIGYWLSGEGRYVDDRGAPVMLPVAGGARTVTPVLEDGRPVAVLVHENVLEDPELIEGIAAAARLAISNVRLHAEVRHQVASVEASRRRILNAADGERQALGQELRAGAERRLGRVAELLDEGHAGPLSAPAAALTRAREELSRLARGIHPATLTEDGLDAALRELVERVPVPIDLRVSAAPLPVQLEAALYFICAETLANVVKHAHASRVAVTVTSSGGRVLVEVEDDGIGGADTAHGSGLRGLGDRAEALGGRLAVQARVGGGTRVVAEMPLGETPEHFT